MNISEKYLEEIKQSFSSEEEFQAFLNSCQMPLKKSIKISLHKILPEEFIQETKPQGWKLTDPGFIKSPDFLPNDVFYVDREDTSIPLWKTFYHQSGFFYIQEVAAWMPARQLFDNSDVDWEIILDMSAAPWGKSVQIWDYLQFLNKEKDLWIVVSNDLSKSRLMAASFNLNRMWIFNSVITNFNGFSFWKNLPEFFDKVLLDAPCSWEWTGFKSDFWLKYWRKEEINKIASTQYQLLVSALKTVKVGWVIVFSTCTMNPYENEFNLKKLMKEYPWIVELEEVFIENKDPWLTTWNDEQLLSESEANKVARFWPHKQKTWWFFIAKLRKVSSLSKDNFNENKLVNKKTLNFEDNKKLQEEVKKLLKNYFWIITDDKKHYFVSTKNYVYLTSPVFKKLKWFLSFEKIGLPILKRNNRGQMRPTHYLWIVFWDIASKNIALIDLQSAYKYGLGEDLSEGEFTLENIDDPLMNYVILKYKKWGIWVAKFLDGRLKNKYIKS